MIINELTKHTEQNIQTFCNKKRYFSNQILPKYKKEEFAFRIILHIKKTIFYILFNTKRMLL